MQGTNKHIKNSSLTIINQQSKNKNILIQIYKNLHYSPNTSINLKTQSEKIFKIMIQLHALLKKLTANVMKYLG